MCVGVLNLSKRSRTWFKCLRKGTQNFMIYFTINFFVFSHLMCLTKLCGELEYCKSILTQ